MPTYDYRCTACDHSFEEFQSMSAKTLKKCPACGKNTLERLIGIGAGVIFKGSGFYETDYRSESYKKAADADKPKTDTPAASGESGGGGQKGTADKTADNAAASTTSAAKPGAKPASTIGKGSSKGSKAGTA